MADCGGSAGSMVPNHAAMRPCAAFLSFTNSLSFSFAVPSPSAACFSLRFFAPPDPAAFFVSLLSLSRPRAVAVPVSRLSRARALPSASSSRSLPPPRLIPPRLSVFSSA